MAHAKLLAAQIEPWREGDGPLAERLAAALAAVIERGVLDGVRLPAERELARELEVSRSTVTRAYALLREARLVASRERSGTVVRPLGTRRPDGAQIPQLRKLLRSEVAGGGVDLSVGGPPLDDLVSGLTVTLGDAAGLVSPHGYAPRGLGALREAVARHESAAGVPTAPDEVLITSGGQEALTLVFELLAGRRQPVAFDAPTYPGALEAAEHAGAVPAAVERDGAGMRPDALRALLARTAVGLVYLMPGCGNPTGAAIPRGRARRLLSVAAEHDALVLEDSSLDAVRYAGPPAPLRALAPQRVLRIGSLSKLAWGGLRLGWVTGPRDVVGRLARIKGGRDLGEGVLGQLGALRLLERVDELGAARRAQAQARMRVLVAELRRRIPEWEIDEPEGGWSLWVRLPGVDGEAFAAAASRRGVEVAPGSAHFPGAVASQAVRISFTAPEPLLVVGAERLAAAWDDVRDEAAARRADGTSRLSAAREAPAAASRTG
jgi:DNA-binding transcriptional MocR family regulator